MMAWLKNLSFRNLLIFSALLSIVFSILELLPSNPVDPDALRYVKAAQAYWQGGWAAATASYNWPLFSVISAWISRLTHFGLLSSMHILNTVLQSLLVVCFIWMNKLLGGDERCQRWSALVILIYPVLNSIRDYATRDSGYWAFGLLAICFLLKFLSDHQWRDAIGFGVAMIIASLFRVEGFIILLTAPIALLFQPQQLLSKRIQHFFVANCVFIIAIILGCFWHELHHHVQSGDASRLQEYRMQLSQVIPDIIHRLHADAEKIRISILNDDSQENGLTILLGGLTMIYVTDIIMTLKILNFILAIYAQRQSLISNRFGQVGLLYWLLIVNLIMLAIFVLERYFLSSRYPEFMVLLWMAWVPFGLQRIHQNWQARNACFTGKRWLWPVIVLVLIYMAAGGLIRFGYSKSYIVESSYWLAEQSKPQDKFFTSERQVHFYATHEFTDAERDRNFTEGQSEQGIQHACKFDWLILRVNKNDRKNAAVEAFIATHQAEKTFANKRNDRILIYKTAEFCTE